MENPNYAQYPRFEERRVRFEALSEAFTWFGRDWQLYMAAAIPALVALVVNIGFNFAATFQAIQSGTQPSAGASLVGNVVSVLAAIVQYLTIAALIRLALRRLDGQAATPFSGFEGLPWLSLLGASIIVGLLTALGSCLCILPGFIAAGLLMLTYPLITEQRLGVIDAVGRSVDATKPNLWTATGLYFVASLVYGVSILVCGVGMLAGLPILAITVAIVYRDLFPTPNVGNAAPPVGY